MFLSGLRTNFASRLEEPLERPVDDALALLRVDFFGTDALDDDSRERDFLAVEEFFFEERALLVEGRLDLVLDRSSLDLALLLRLGARDLDARGLDALDLDARGFEDRDLNARDFEPRGLSARDFDVRALFSTRVVRLELLRPSDDFER